MPIGNHFVDKLCTILVTFFSKTRLDFTPRGGKFKSGGDLMTSSSSVVLLGTVIPRRNVSIAEFV